MSGRVRLFGSLLRGSLLERRGRIALAVAAIAIGTSVAAALVLVSRDVGSKVEKELAIFGPNLVLAPAAGDLPIGAGDLRLGAVGGAPHFGEPARTWLAQERAGGRIAQFATLRYGAARYGEATVVTAATDLADLTALHPAWRIDSGDEKNADAYVGATAAQALGVRPGAALTLDVGTAGAPHPLALAHVAVLASGGAEDRIVFIPRASFASAAGTDAQAFHVALARANGPSRAVLAYAAQPLPPELGGEGASLRAIKQLSAADGVVLERLRLLLVTVTAVALAAAALCAMSTLADLVLERTREIALLRALGAGRRDVLALFATEAVVMGLIGGTVGFGIGAVAAQAIGRSVFGTAIALAPFVLLLSVALGIATALVASLLPARHALAIEPAPVLRGE